MSDWIEVVAPRDMRVVSPIGDRAEQLAAGVPTLVHPSLFAAAIAAGCSVPGGSQGLTKTDEEVVEALVEAMLDIVTAGKPVQLTADGEPRYSFLKDRVPQFTPEHRAQAWAQVQAQMAGSNVDEDAEE
jgi:hypothetical protein